MKKTLSIIFALAMFLSVVSFAAPSLVGTVGTAEETDSFTSPVVDTAEVLADDYSIEVLHLTFDNDGTAMELPLNNYGTVNFPASFPALANTKLTCSYPSYEIKDGKLVVSSSVTENSWPRFVLSTGSLPKGMYKILVTVTNNCAERRDISFSFGNTAYGSRYVNANETKTVDMTIIFDGKRSYNVESTSSIAKNYLSQLDVYTSPGGKQTDLVFDDVKLYFTPIVDVTFDTNGVVGTTLPNVSVISGNTIDLSAYTLPGDDTHIFNGWTTADGTDVTGIVTITENTTFKAKWDVNYGTLVYDVTFDNNEGEPIALSNNSIDKFGTVNLVDGFPAINKTYLYNSFKIAADNSNPSVVKNGRAEVSADKGYPRFAFQTGGSFPEGRYTLSVDFTNRNSTAKSVTFSHDNTGLGHSVSAPAGETRTAVINLTYDDGILYCVESKKSIELSRLHCFAMYTHIGDTIVSPALNYSYDNIKLYYKPFVEVSFVNDKTDESFDTLKIANGTTINVENYKLNNTDKYAFLGWADSNGNIITGYITINSNTTLTAVWQELYSEDYGKLVMDLHFNTPATLFGESIVEYGLVNFPENFPDASKITFSNSFKTSSLGGGKVTVSHQDKNGYPSFEIKSPTNFPYGKYHISYVVKTIATETKASVHSFTVRMRGSGDLGLFEPPTGVTLNTPIVAGGTFTYVDGVVSYYAWGNQTKPYANFTIIGPMVGTKEAATFEFDDILLYYKAPIKVTFADPAGYAAELPAAVTAFDGETYAGLDEIVCASNDSTKVFKGWATSENGEVIGNETAVLTSATTLYAVWEDKYIPSSYNLSSIRTDAYTGIRFMASVTSEQKEEVAEYGFIVTLKKLLGDKVLTHDTDVTYVQGINYGVVDGKGIDKIYEIKDDNIFFTAVVYGFPKTADAYTSAFVVRPFTKLNGVYYYGDAVERSVCQVAENLRDKNYADMTADAIETVKGILTECGKATEPQA